MSHTRLLLAVMLLLPLPATRAQLLQATGPLPTFEVATVKPSSPGSTSSQALFSGASLTIQNQTLEAILKLAYHATANAQLVLPEWAHSTHYDISARIDEPTVAAMQKMPPDLRANQARLMLQALLIDRFKMKATVQTRELPTYALVLAKGGSKLTPSDCPNPCAHGTASNGNGRLDGKDAPLEFLIAPLARQSELGGRTIVDETGLKDSYSWTLRWTPADSPSGTDLGPDLFTALPEQLGLKLEPTKRPVQVLVVEHMEPPGEN